MTDTQGEGRQIVLYAERHERGSYYLRASLGNDRTLVFSGQDLGASVEDHFGYPEYEYIIRVAPEEVRKLMRVLGQSGDVLDAVEKHFANDDIAWRPRSWLDEQGIEWEFWARTGP